MSQINFYGEAEKLFKLVPEPNDTSPNEIRNNLKELVNDYQVPLDEARESILKSDLEKYGLHSDGPPVEDQDLRDLYESVKEELEKSPEHHPHESDSQYSHQTRLGNKSDLTEAADEFVSKANEKPSNIDLKEYQNLFTSDQVTIRKKATQAARLVSRHEPEALEDVDEELTNALDDSNEQVCALAAISFKNLIDVKPSAGLNAISQFEHLITVDDETTRLCATYCLGTMAEEYPSDLLRTVDTILDHIHYQEETFQTNCLSLLLEVGQEHPNRFTTEIQELQKLLNSGTKNAQIGVLDLLTVLSKTSPEALRPIIDDVVTVIEGGDEELIEHAVYCLSYFAEDYPRDLEEHTDVIEGALGDGTDQTEIFIPPLLDQIENPDEQDDSSQNLDATNSSKTTTDIGDGDSDETLYLESPPDIDFFDIAGMSDLKRRLQEQIIDPLNNPKKYDTYGVGVEKGILLFGPPGTGKTYLSKALAGELDINWAKVKGSDIISKWVGEGSENIAELFDEARDHQPCMVFIDEIDALSPERNSSTQTHNEMAMVNTLLEEVSEVNEGDEDIIVVAATNRENQIDEAMLRSGRLSKKIEVPPPDEDTRRQIFDYHLDAPRAVDLELDPVGKQTVGLTAADMEQVATNAARNALKREGRVTLEDVQTAIDGVTSGKRSVSTFVSTPPDLDFSEVAGMENLKTKLSEKIIDPIQNPEENEKYGLSVSNGFLLHGPAGTGKTYISKALAGELGINFANITVTDLLSKWAGEGPDNIDTVFKEARQYAPCLVFIDEIDALIPKRGNRSQTQSQTNMVNTFLEELTTIEEEDHDVVVIGATNRIEQIDDAMLRSGRLSSKIHVPAPDPTARCDILDYHLNAPRADDLTLASIKDATEGLTAADMKEVANRAARSAKKHEREVTNEDLKDAVHSISATSSNVTRLNEHSEEKTNSLQDQHSEPQY